MLFDTLDIRLVAPAEVTRIQEASALGSVAVRIDSEEFGVMISPYCSGFLVSPRHVLTTAHCARTDLVFNQKHMSRPEDVQKLGIVPFGPILRLVFEGETISNPEEDASTQRLGEPLYKNETLDFAVFAVESPTSAQFVDLRSVSMTTQAELEGLTLYGYPNGIPLSESSHCRGIPSPLPDVLFHDCDSLTGSSGGLVVSVSSGRAVAMHLGASGQNDVAYFQRTGHFEPASALSMDVCAGATNAPDRQPMCIEMPGYNRAIDLGSVVRALKNEAPSVWKDILAASGRADRGSAG